MVPSPKERGPRLSVMCVHCGKWARLQRIEAPVFGQSVNQAIYECDCGGVVKRVVKSSSSELGSPSSMGSRTSQQ